jgi:hypothetical protein
MTLPHKTPKIPHKIRQEAAMYLRHYPYSMDTNEAFEQI